MPRISWNDDMISAGLLEHAKITRRMPSASELRKSGENALACAVARHGGFRAWSERLELPIKASETALGRSMEGFVAAALRKAGRRVDRQTVRAPFDLLVDGSIRVDVKAGHWGEYFRASDGYCVRGYVFAGLKQGKCCDVFILLCLDEGSPVRVFVVPAVDASVHTITVTPKVLAGDGKWSPFEVSMDTLSESLPNRGTEAAVCP